MENTSNLTKEQLEQAAKAESAAALQAKTHENGTPLSDEEVDNVSGGTFIPRLRKR